MKIHKQCKLYTKPCKYCSTDFEGTRTQRLCTSCKGTRKPVLQKTEIEIRCVKCDSLKEVVTKNITKNSSSNIRHIGLCVECKKETRILMSKSKRGPLNPNYDSTKTSRKSIISKIDENGLVKKYRVDTDGEEHVIKKRIKSIPPIRKPRSEILAELSYRMTVDNPMFNDETKIKVKDTLHERILNGQIKYKRGPEHHLWKGHRDQAQRIRDVLHIWKRQCLVKSNYKCELCGSNKYLEIHHVKPLRDIITSFAGDRPLREYDVTSPEFSSLTDNILNYHLNNNIGQVLCLDCHVEIDPHRHYSLPHYVYRKYKKNQESK